MKNIPMKINIFGDTPMKKFFLRPKLDLIRICHHLVFKNQSLSQLENWEKGTIYSFCLNIIFG